MFLASLQDALIHFCSFINLWVSSLPGLTCGCGTERVQHLGTVTVCVRVKIKTHSLRSTFCPLEQAANVTIFISKFSFTETNKNTAGHKAIDQHK